MRFRYSYRKKAKLFANSGDPDHTPRSAASDLGLHCLPITRLGVSRLQWLNTTSNLSYQRREAERTNPYIYAVRYKNKF